MKSCSHAATIGGDAASIYDGIVLYDETDLHPIGDPPDSVHGMELVAMLYGASHADDRAEIVRAELDAIGVEWLEYGRVQWDDRGLQPLSFLRSYVPDEWTTAYCRDRLWEQDDRLLVTPCSGVPRLWAVDAVEPASQRSAERRPSRALFERLAACGVGSGTTVVLPMPVAGQGAVVHLLARAGDLQWATKEALARALLLAVCLNEFVTNHTAPPGPPDVGTTLSTLQARIAHCIVRGDSDKEVARSMAMSSHAVDYHLRTLRRKFNVRNRVQLAQAINRVGIAPSAGQSGDGAGRN